MIDGGTGQEQDQKCEIIQGEAADIIAGTAGVVFDIFSEGDEAGQGCNQGADSTDVDTDEQVGIVPCELGQ